MKNVAVEKSFLRKEVDVGFSSPPEPWTDRGFHCGCKEGNETKVREFIEDMGKNIPIFSLLDDSERCEIVPLFEMFLLPECTVFSSSCFPEDFIAVVASGKLLLKAPSDLRGKQTPLALLSRGAHFESFSLLDNRPLAVTASALSETVLLIVTREKLYEFMRKNPLIALKVFKGIAGVLEIRLQSVQRRVAGFY